MTETLRKFVENWPSAKTTDIKSWAAMGLANALGWGLADSTITRLRPGGLTIDVSEASVAGQPALLFCSTVDEVSNNTTDKVALFAYHCAIEWGLVTNGNETVLFNSHWVKNGSWYRSPVLSRSDILRHEEVFDCLTPDAVVSGNTSITTERFGSPERSLLPVDDALVDRLDWWRAEALKHTQDFRGIDERLQQLFAQLFVLRSIEDRKLSHTLPPISIAVRGGDVANKTKLREIFRAATEEVQRDLFEASSFKDIPGFILGGIIQDLYRPAHIPFGDARYNFAWLSAPVLGRAYEKYLSTALVPSRILDRQLSLWNQPVRGVERIGVRKASGAYYTPEYVARLVTERCLDAWYESHDATAIPTILDPACGSGTFLVTALDSLLKRLRQVDPARSWGRDLIAGRKVCGIDLDERAVTLARLTVWLRLTEEVDPLPLPGLLRDIVVGDALAEEPWRGLPNEIDLIIGNPPFMSKARVGSAKDLSRRFAVAQGRFDLAYVFVEQAIRKLPVRGQLGLVVPNRMLSARDAAPLREILATHLQLRLVVDFSSEQIFFGANAYVALLIGQKTEAPPVEPTVRVVQVIKLPDRFAGHHILTVALARGDTTTDAVHGFDAKRPSGKAPWLLVPIADMKTRFSLEDSGRRLSEVANTYQGIKTAANDLFIFGEAQDFGSFLRLQNGIGDTVEIERDLLRPVVYGADIQRYSFIRTSRYLLYPYRGGRVIREDELRSRYPRGYKYLLSMRTPLEARASIARTERKIWYELAWERDELWLSSKKIVSRELATRNSFAIDDVGDIFLVGGIAVVPADENCLLPLLGYLNSRFAERYLKATLPSFQSSFYKYETQSIAGLPIPEQLLDGSSIALTVSDLVGEILVRQIAGQEWDDLELCIDDALSAEFGFLDQRAM